jgi:hypothetical protein
MTRYRFAWICLAAAAITTAAVLNSVAQPPVQPAAGAAPRVIVAEPNSAGFTSYRPLYAAAAVDAGELHKSQEKAAAALKTYSAAETDEQRTAAEKDLQNAVSEQFEVLMKSREDQIAELKSRLDKLTEQLQKRRDAKEQIVKLRVQVLVNEAQGLGFYPEGTPAWPAMGYGPGGYGAGYAPSPVEVPRYPGTTPAPASR